MIKDSSGSRQIMCIESGIDYNAGGTYDSVSGKNSSYFQNLPTTAQYGIMLTSVYGWRPGKTAPVSGTNEDDFAIATQSILWEYQQQLRTSPTTLAANSYDIPADTYYKGIQGRPAEKCYDWLLSQMESHATVPSFASHRSSSAEVYTLKYNQAADNYSLTLTDTNNTLADIKFSAGGITVSRSGNQYTFTSKKMIESAVSITAQKNIPNIDGNILIWGYPGKQTMMSGAEDPVVFYLKVKTETTGVGHIVKHSEDNKVDGIKFNIAGNGVNQTVTTKKDGTVDIELMPGVYTVTELAEEKYEPQSVQRVTIVSGHTSTVTFSNVLKRTGNPYIKEKMDLDIDVSRLKLLKANHLSQIYSLEDKVHKEFPAKIAALEERIKGFDKDIATANSHPAGDKDNFCGMTVKGVSFSEKKDAGEAIIAACKAMSSPDAINFGSYRGFDMELSFDTFSKEYKITLIGELRHTVILGTDIFGNILRLDNAIGAFSERQIACKEQLDDTKVQLENAKAESQKPFPHEEELKTKSARLAELNTLLDMDKRDNELVDGERVDDAEEPDRSNSRDAR